MGQKFNWGRALGAGLSSLGQSMYESEKEKRRRQEQLDDEARRRQNSRDDWLWQQEQAQAIEDKANPYVRVGMKMPGMGVTLPVRQNQVAGALANAMFREPRRENPSWDVLEPGEQGNPWPFPATRGDVADYHLRIAGGGGAAGQPSPKESAYYAALGNPTASGGFDIGYALPEDMYLLYGNGLWQGAMSRAMQAGVDPRDAEAMRAIVADVAAGLTPDFSHGYGNLAYDPGTNVFHDPRFVKGVNERQDLAGLPDWLSPVYPDWMPDRGKYSAPEYYNAGVDKTGRAFPTTEAGNEYRPVPADRWFVDNVVVPARNGWITEENFKRAMERYGVGDEQISAWVAEAFGTGAEPTDASKGGTFNPYSDPSRIAPDPFGGTSRLNIY